LKKYPSRMACWEIFHHWNILKEKKFKFLTIEKISKPYGLLGIFSQQNIGNF
jgi:hypothetical protein